MNTCRKSCFPHVLGRFLPGIISDCHVLLADKMYPGVPIPFDKRINGVKTKQSLLKGVCTHYGVVKLSEGCSCKNENKSNVH